MGRMSLQSVFTRITNEAIHDLSSSGLTHAERSALALGPKFLPSPNHLSCNALYASIDRFERSVRWKYHLRNAPSNANAVDIRFALPSTRTPKPAAKVIENYLSHVRDSVLQSRHDLTPMPSNLSVNVRQGLNSLRKRSDIVVKFADKNLGLVAVDTEWYLSQAEAHLSATCLISSETQPAYMKITNLDVPILELSVQLTNILERHGKRIFPAKIKDFITTFPQPMKPGRFYLTIKVHKDPIATRPICSTIPWLTTPAAAWLDSKLQPLLKAEPNCITSSLSLLKIISDAKFRTAKYLATFDVVSLYPSIVIDTALANLTARYGPGSPMETEDWPAILDLLNFVLRNNYFEFNDQLYKQLQGVAMGVKPAVPFASLFMVTIEEPVLRTFAQNLLLYKRFIDDGFLIWSGNYDSLVKFFHALGSVDPNIKITFEISPTSAIFLDLSLTLNDDGIITSSLYQKPMNLYPYIPFASAHSHMIKRSFIKAELNRYVLACSNEDSYASLKVQFFKRLRARGYPPSFLRPLFIPHEYSSRCERLKSALSAERVKKPVSPFVIQDSPNARQINWGSILKPPASIRHDSDLAPVIPRPLAAFSNPPTLRYKLERGAHEPRL